jgi:hypothetical protein
MLGVALKKERREKMKKRMNEKKKKNRINSCVEVLVA